MLSEMNAFPFLQLWKISSALRMKIVIRTEIVMVIKIDKMQMILIERCSEFFSRRFSSNKDLLFSCSSVSFEEVINFSFKKNE